MGKLFYIFLIILFAIFLVWSIYAVSRRVARDHNEEKIQDAEDRLAMQETANHLELQMDHADERERIRRGETSRPKKGK